jgi:hypothetical protein
LWTWRIFSCTISLSEVNYLEYFSGDALDISRLLLFCLTACVASGLIGNTTKDLVSLVKQWSAIIIDSWFDHIHIGVVGSMTDRGSNILPVQPRILDIVIGIVDNLVWHKNLPLGAVDVLSFWLSLLWLNSSCFFVFFEDLVFLIPRTSFCIGVTG